MNGFRDVPKTGLGEDVVGISLGNLKTGCPRALRRRPVAPSRRRPATWSFGREGRLSGWFVWECSGLFGWFVRLVCLASMRSETLPDTSESLFSSLLGELDQCQAQANHKDTA